MRLRATAFFIAFFVALSQGHAQATRFGTVYLRVASPLGFQARKAEIKVTEQTTGKSYSENVHGFAIERLPFGKYTLDIQSPMLVTKPVDLTIDSETKWITITFPFEAPVDRWIEQPAPRLHGVAQRRGRGAKAWIKVMGIYTRDMFETQADETGEFMLTGVPEGLYVLVSTDAQGATVTQVVKVLGAVTEVAVPYR